MRTNQRPDEYTIVHTLPHNVRSICRTVFNAGVSRQSPAFYYVDAPDDVPDDAPTDVLRETWYAVNQSRRDTP